MRIAEFQKLSTSLQGMARPAAPEQLRCAVEWLQLSLQAVGAFEEVEVDHTGDTDRLLIALCTFDPELSAQEVAWRLELMWQDRVRYGFWEAHAVTVEDDHVELQAATRESTAGHYVTLHVVCQRATLPRQRTVANHAPSEESGLRDFVHGLKRRLFSGGRDLSGV